MHHGSQGQKAPHPVPAVAAILAALPDRLIVPPLKIWNRGATFAKWELDTIQEFALKHRHDPLSSKVREILSTKKI